VPEADAAIVAACLVSADLRGVDTHGLTRLPGYLDRVRRGLTNSRPVLAPTRVTPLDVSDIVAQPAGPHRGRRT